MDTAPEIDKNNIDETPLHILEKENPKKYKELFKDEDKLEHDYKDFIIDQDDDVKFIADVFPEKKLTLLHGQQGSGKSYSCIKALNKVDIKPVYIAVEETSGLDELDCDYLSAKILNHLMRLEPFNLKDKVVIIDTYSRLHEGLMTEYKTEQEIPLLLERMMEYYDITIIVVGHTRPFVGKDGIFNDNVSLARFASEELFLEKSEYKASQKKPARIQYDLHVKKARGMGGARVIENWMRE